jgi:hypothetical protein
MRKKKDPQGKEDGTDNKQWIKWLLDFYGQDLDRLTSAQQDKLNRQITIFSNLPTGLHLNTEGTHLLRTSRPGIGTGWREFSKRLSLRQLKFIQQKLRECLAHLMPEDIPEHENGEIVVRTWDIPVSINKIQLSRADYRVRPKGDHTKYQGDQSPIGKFRRMFLGDMENMFWPAVAEILENDGFLLRRCEECNTIFLKTKRQQYCSRKCSQRVRTRKWNAAHGLNILKKRQEDLVKKIQELEKRVTHGTSRT